MKKTILILSLFLTACGYSAKESEVIGQVKKVVNVTPLICSDRNEIDLSLGVIRGGVGSMSSEDIFMNVSDPTSLATLKAANETGSLVKVIYNTYRVAFCQEPKQVVRVELVK